MFEKIRMMSDRVLVEPIYNNQTTESGIFIGSAKTTFTQHAGKDEQICSGRVVSVGKGKHTDDMLEPVGVEVGQYVAFSDTCHRPAGIKNKDLKVIRGGDVMLVSDAPFDHVEVLY